MEIKIIKIGHSKGLVIPSDIIRVCEIKDKVKLIIDKNRIILEPVKEG